MSHTDAEYFERLYQGDPDPWKFASSEYERTKYASTLEALPRRRFTRAFEVGCSIGVFTRQLAARCDTVLGVDVSETALDHARARCSDLVNVSLDRMAVPGAWPSGSFDLVVFSEVLYYLDIVGTARRTLDGLAPGGVVVLVNWLGETGAGCSGDQAATRFIAATAGRLAVVGADRAETYRVDVLG